MCGISTPGFKRSDEMAWDIGGDEELYYKMCVNEDQGKGSEGEGREGRD